MICDALAFFAGFAMVYGAGALRAWGMRREIRDVANDRDYWKREALRLQEKWDGVSERVTRAEAQAYLYRERLKRLGELPE